MLGGLKKKKQKLTKKECHGDLIKGKGIEILQGFALRDPKRSDGRTDAAGEAREGKGTDPASSVGGLKFMGNLILIRKGL